MMRNLKDIWTVTKKELRAGFSDKIVLFQILLMPFLMVFGYASLMLAVGEGASVSQTEEEVLSYYVNAPSYLEDGLKSLNLQSTDKDNMEELKLKIKEKECTMLVVFPENFVMEENSLENLSNIEIWYNSTNSESYKAFSNLSMYLASLQPKLFLVNANLEETYDMGDEEELLKDMLSGIMPTFLITAVYIMIMSLSAESIAGDKERGFLNTMLITPVKRSSIAAGKALYLLIASILGGLSAFIGMAISLPKLGTAMEISSTFNYTVTEYILLFVITITTVFVLTSGLLIISTFAKDIKQATTISPMFMMVLMLGGMLGTMEGFKPMIESLGVVNDLIPAWNTIFLMQDIIKLDYSMSTVFLTCGINILFSTGAIFFIGKCFESEKIINNE